MKAALLIAVALLSGCAVTKEPGETGPEYDKVTVTIEWHNADTILRACTLQGPAKPTTNSCAVWIGRNCTIYAVKPMGFNDNFRLQILGHEFYHCLGAKH